MEYAVTLLLVSVLSHSIASDVVVTTRLGEVTGTTEDVNGTQVRKYFGIPYAKPPVGELRFAKPKAYGSFEGGKLDSTTFGSDCPQSSGLSSNYLGSEHCLFLNVYTPDTARKRSVLIWIHGGGFVVGSGRPYDATNIVAQEDVVVVTINYRLGVLGFLSTGDDKIPGNYGLWDQRLAIEWVKNNIEDYGGDSNSITLFGESAGAMSGSFHMLSPKCNASLFQRVITESGSALAISLFLRDPLPLANFTVDALNCSLDNNLVKCLKDKPVDVFMNFAENNGQVVFLPVIDNDYLHHDIGKILDSFTQHHASPATKKMLANFASYDLFSGWNDQEGLYTFSTLEMVNKGFNRTNVTKGVSAEVLKEALGVFPFVRYGALGNKDYTSLIIDIFTDYYMNNPHLPNSDGRSVEERRLEIFTQLTGDVMLKLPTIQQLQLHALASNKNTFGYEFSHRRNSPALFEEGPDWLRSGAVHADEIPFVFGFRSNYIGDGAYIPTAEELELSRKMMRHWANFARTGNPSTEDYDLFEFPRSQSYTLLKTGTFEKLSFPANDEVRLLLAVNSAVIAQTELNELTTPTATTTAEDVCVNLTSPYLNGLLKLTTEEADGYMTGTLVVTVLLGAVCIVLILSLVSFKWKMTRSKKN